jgi:hypothetical protein
MTTPPLGPEDRLAALLREQAETVVPAGDGLARIRTRVAARRRARWFLIPSAAVATGLAAVAVLVLQGPDDKSSLRQVTAPSPSTSATATEQPSPSPEPSANPQPSATPVPGVSPQPSTSATRPATSAFVPAIWPFASHAQVEAWRADQSSKPWAGDNLGVAQHFVTDYLKLTGVHLVQSCLSCDVVSIVNSDGRDVGTIGLVREDDGWPRAYSVSTVTYGSGFQVTSPTEGAAIRSGTTVSGTIVGVDENIPIALMTQDGRTIGTAATPAGSGRPWSTTLTWTDDNWYTGALVLKTYSPKDGVIDRLIVLRVTRGT